MTSRKPPDRRKSTRPAGPANPGTWNTRRKGVEQMQLQDVWDGLSKETKDWFRQNPGCRVLPRTLVNTIRTDYLGPIVLDQDGMMALTPEDLQFLLATLRSARETVPATHFQGTAK